MLFWIQLIIFFPLVYIAVLSFSFELTSYEISEEDSRVHGFFVMIENFNSVDIPDGVSIEISANISALSNATQGKNDAHWW